MAKISAKNEEGKMARTNAKHGKKMAKMNAKNGENKLAKMSAKNEEIMMARMNAKHGERWRLSHVGGTNDIVARRVRK